MNLYERQANPQVSSAQQPGAPASSPKNEAAMCTIAKAKKSRPAPVYQAPRQGKQKKDKNHISFEKVATRAVQRGQITPQALVATAQRVAARAEERVKQSNLLAQVDEES